MRSRRASTRNFRWTSTPSAQCAVTCAQSRRLSTDFRRTPQMGLDRHSLEKGRSPQGWAGVCPRVGDRLELGFAGRLWRALLYWPLWREHEIGYLHRLIPDGGLGEVPDGCRLCATPALWLVRMGCRRAGQARSAFRSAGGLRAAPVRFGGQRFGLGRLCDVGLGGCLRWSLCRDMSACLAAHVVDGGRSSTLPGPPQVGIASWLLRARTGP
jgi:hypothetical protein